jgi:hypothetical protein
VTRLLKLFKRENFTHGVISRGIKKIPQIKLKSSDWSPDGPSSLQVDLKILLSSKTHILLIVATA